MKDVNWPIRKIYHTVLTGISYNSIAVNNYYQKAPDEITDNNYIVFGGINNNDVSNKTVPETETSMRVTIHTYQVKYNDGRAADDIAGQIFDALYPNANTRPDMSADGLQLVDTRLSSDNIQDYNIQNSREYLDRILIFSHRIAHQ